MTRDDRMIDEEALAWVIRTRDPDFADWEGFTLWLEADPAHATAYDMLAARDAELADIVPAAPAAPLPANDPGEPRRSAWRWIGGGAVAAALVALLSVTLVGRADPYSITTAPGEQREIALADGTRIALNGGTTLRLDRAEPRLAALDRGEAVFTVTHDAADPFRVTVGGAVFEDAGTVFNISRTDGVTRIGVAEGEVIYNPKAEAIALPAGRALRAADAEGRVTLSAVAPEAVTGWRSGRLSYDNAPMGDVAADIGRSLGVNVEAGGAAGLRFTGTLVVDKDPERFFAKAAPVLGVKAQRRGAGTWILNGSNGGAT